MPGIDVKMMSYGERVPAQDRYNSEESLEDNQSTTSSTESRQSDFQKKVGPLNTMSMSTIMGKYCRIMSSYPQDPLELWPANPPVTLDNSPESIPILC